MTATTTTVRYDATYPASIQDDDWSCSATALDWALRALGRTPGPSYIEHLLVADGVVSHELGLLDATGAGLAAWIGKTSPADVYYGADGFYGNNEDAITFDEVAREIGPYPLLLGGRNWAGSGLGHWTGVRGYDGGRDTLLLANPAGDGGSYGGQELSAAQFASRGPFSMVRVLHPAVDGSGAVAPPVPGEPPGTPPQPTELPIGYDVASYQGYPNWAAVAGAGTAFAITKATEGVDYRNPSFAHNWSGIKNAGMCRGAYHFARPDLSGPENEAAYFWSIVGPHIAVGDILALDLEDSNGSLSSRPSEVAGWALRFLRYLEQLAGFKPLLYVSPSVISDYHLTDPAFGEFGLWLASWGSSFPATPAPWPVIAFWQAGDHGQVAGINGYVDENYFNGPASSIPLYGKPESVGPPEPEPVPPTDGDQAAQIAALEAEVAALEAEVARLNSVLGYASHDVADAFAKEADTIDLANGAIRAAISTLRGLHP